VRGVWHREYWRLNSSRNKDTVESLSNRSAEAGSETGDITDMEVASFSDGEDMGWDKLSSGSDKTPRLRTVWFCLRQWTGREIESVTGEQNKDQRRGEKGVLGVGWCDVWYRD